MMKYSFDECPDRRCTESDKWNYFEEDILPMWVADMDFVSPQPVIAALEDRAAHGVFGYPRYTQELREVIIDWVSVKHAWQVNPDYLVFLPGVVTGFNLACHMMADEPGSVIVQPPIYPPILAAPGNAGLERVDAKLCQNTDGSWIIDWDIFESALTQKPKLFLLCNPHNPTGRVLDESELIRIANLCLEHDIFICSDEIHCDLVYPGKHHISIGSIDPEIAANTITLISPSKTFNIAGLQFSVAIIPDLELRKKFLNSRKGLVNEINLMGITAAMAAYRYGEDWLQQLIGYLHANRDFLYQFIQTQTPEIRMGLPEATYLAWLDLRGLHLPEKPADFFVHHAKVGLSDGKYFGSGGEGFVRMNFGCPRDQLELALDNMLAAIQAKRV